MMQIVSRKSWLLNVEAPQLQILLYNRIRTRIVAQIKFPWFYEITLQNPPLLRVSRPCLAQSRTAKSKWWTWWYPMFISNRFWNVIGRETLVDILYPTVAAHARKVTVPPKLRSKIHLQRSIDQSEWRKQKISWFLLVDEKSASRSKFWNAHIRTNEIGQYCSEVPATIFMRTARSLSIASVCVHITNLADLEIDGNVYKYSNLTYVKWDRRTSSSNFYANLIHLRRCAPKLCR